MRLLIASDIMTRTTIDLDPGVLRRLRSRSRREGKSMGQLASEVLARSLAEEPLGSQPAFEWLSRELGEPSVDLEDKEALRACLEPK
jgi:plasmid stability protein